MMGHCVTYAEYSLGAEGRWFESSRPDHSHPRGPQGPLPGAGSCAAAWAWFRMGEVRVRPSAAAVVQLVEQQPSKLPVAGSSPVRRSIAHEATATPWPFSSRGPLGLSSFSVVAPVATLDAGLLRHPSPSVAMRLRDGCGKFSARLRDDASGVTRREPP